MTPTTPLPTWERRFRAPTTSMPDWSRHAPDRLVYAGNESGVWQVHCLDAVSGKSRQVTDHPVGVTDGTPTLDGSGVLWFADETGAESGRWYVAPFTGGEARPFLQGVPDGWSDGLAQAPGIVAAAVSGPDGFAVYVSLDGGPAREIARSGEALGIAGGYAGGFNRAGLTADGSLLCLEHSEQGDLIHPALRVVDPRTGVVVGEQIDEGMALSAACWSPLPGDQRLAIVHEREGEERPAIWDLATGERTELRVDLPGVVTVGDWYPDGEALLLVNLHEGRNRLFRYEVTSGALAPIDHPAGTIDAAHVRPDGRVWYRQTQGDREPVVLDDLGRVVLRPAGEPAPRGRSYGSWHFTNEHGQRVHGFLVTPGGSGPFPVIMHPHGGPTWLDTDRWSPWVQGFVDAGFAVGLVNYRGSTGYGREWRDALIGDIGGPEIEDLNAGLRDLVARGIADPARAVVAGWSWGGYLTLMELGKHPALWIAGVAGVPIGDYEMSYDDMSPLLQAYDRALLGGAPADVPELMRERNPINFVDGVTAPVLFLIGDNDSRCPLRQALAYVERLDARGHPHEVYRYATGHSSFDLDERVRQMRLILDFLSRHVPGVERLPGV